ncbi:fimbria/pilus periplasmic chaperone [Serratia sp. M24T3]|uniref:fimbria/pilus periplasmic chaperone n=1 Tax=Serratia sp. M24T3 TaxID=932213 RepID=UPI00025BB3F4|nr:fimbria/pilus periplasmic chaperone [Serratia sp. M24T3]EIC85710.1 fimbrial chaperone protein FimC [Serratia sp. M24T3]
MNLSHVKKTATLVFILSAMLAPLYAQAEGGLSIQGTRIVYPQGSKQVSISMTNSSTTESFLVQSRVEDAAGNKTQDFIVTPPLYLSGPKNENVVRIMHVGKELPGDRESLYYFIEKAIPSLDKSKVTSGSVLMLATANRIKLFVRPKGLTQDVNTAPQSLHFYKTGNTLHISNPSPYYLTMTEIKYGNEDIPGIMIAPKEQATLPLPAGNTHTISYRTINDFGGNSDIIKKKIDE